MSNHTMNYTLSFSADTTKAKAQLRDLKQSLDNLTTKKIDSSSFTLTDDLNKSLVSAEQLKKALNEATNKKTGKLDLTSFNSSMKAAGKSLKDYKRDLEALGPSGEKAFISLAQSVANAETPMKKAKGLLHEMKQSLVNTIGWQLSSSAIHGFMSAISGAFSYAERLNKSLNNIRIVTSQSTEDMSKFAAQANKAAQKLSTTTTAYTDAALIYYQQGLSDEEVQRRTEATIKMANVTGESASHVSSYMTAIWNNFAEGSDNLTYYSDVLTALGAATAASSEEIANGLEKFAAVGETVGLSYEYATSALTTIVDKTRQSEDVVGTALKTIFARIQGLQQGETQEDGVTLNKYSKALKNVGIEVLSANGELKQMDQILDEMGSKWETLSQAEQVALAQTVGGTRQYTQLISLMENWDSFQDNVDIARNSEGTTDEQAEIYAQSWEAAKKRVTTALEDIYNSLINDEFFIDLTDSLTWIIKQIGNFIDALGGVKGVISMIGTIMLKVFSKDITTGIQKAIAGIKQFTGIGKKEMQSTKQEAIALAKELAIKNQGTSTGTQAKNMVSTLTIQDEILKNQTSLSEQKLRQLEAEFQINQQLKDREFLLSQEADKAEKQANRSKMLANASLSKNNQEHFANVLNKTERIAQQEIKREKITSDIKAYQAMEKKENESNADFEKRKKELEAQIKENVKELKEKIFKDFKDALNKEDFDTIDIDSEAEKLTKKLNERDSNVLNDLKKRGILSEDNKEDIVNAINDRKELGYTKGQLNTASKNVDTSNKNILNSIKDGVNSKKEVSLDQKMISTASAISAAAMAFSTLKGLVDTWKDPEINFADKLLSTATSLGMVIPTAISAVNGLAAAFGSLKLAMIEFIVPIMIVIGAIALLVQGFNYLKSQSPEEQLKKAEEQTKKMKEAADEAAQAYSNLQNSIGDLKSSKLELNKLTEGTEAWRNKLIEVNQQVLDLIETYPELAKYMTSDNGVLGISNEGLQNFRIQQQNEALATQRLTQVANIQENYAKYKQTEEEVLSGNDFELGLDDIWLTDSFGEKIEQLNQEALLEIAKILKENGWNNEENFDYSKVVEAIKKLGPVDDYLKSIDTELISESDALDNLLQTIDFNDNKLMELLDSNKLSKDTGLAAEEKELIETHVRGVADDIIKNRSDIDQSITDPLLDTIANNGSEYAEQLENDEFDEEEVWDKALDDEAKRRAANPRDAVEVAEIREKLENTAEKDEAFKNTLITNYRLSEMINEDINASLDLYKKLSDNENNDLSKEALNAVQKIVAGDGAKEVYEDLDDETAKEVSKFLKNEDNYEALGGDEKFGTDGKNRITKDLDKFKDTDENEKKIEENFKEGQQETAEAYEMDSAAFEQYQEELEKDIKGLDDLIEKHDDLATEITEKNIKWDQSAKELVKTLEDEKEALNSDNLEDRAKALTKVADKTSDLLETDVDSDFVDEHMEDIEKALEGDKEALEELRKEATKIPIDFKNDDLENKFDALYDDINSKLDNIPVGEIDITTPEGKDLALELENFRSYLMNALGMTAQEASDVFNQNWGLKLPNITTKTITVEDTQSVDLTGDSSFIADDGTEISGLTTAQRQILRTKGTITVPVLDDGSVASWEKLYSNSSYTGKTGGNTANYKNSPKSSSSGGGGSKKEKKNAEDEIERYHQINETLDALNKQLDKISKAKDRAFGADKIALMDQEIAKTKDLIAAQQQLLDQTKANYAQDRANVEALGAIIDPDTGVITNYDELMNKILADYNNSGLTETDEEAYQKKKETIERYEETQKALMEAADGLEELKNKLEDAELEKIEYKIQLKIDIDDRELEYLEYALDKLDDETYDAAERIANMAQQTNVIVNKTQTLTEGISDVLELAGMSEDDINKFMSGELNVEELEKLGLTEAQVNSLLDKRKELLENNKQLLEMEKTVWEEVTKAIQGGVEEFGKMGEAIEHNASLLDNFKNIIDLVGADALGISQEMLAEMNQASVETAEANLANSLNNLEYLRKTQQDLELKLLDPSLSQSSREEIQKSLEETTNLLRDAENDMLDDWQTALETAQQAFQDSVDATISAFEKALGGTFGSLTALKQAFENQKKLSDIYVEDFKKVYELNKMNRNIINSMNESDSVSAKNKLREIQEEINALQAQGVKLSEYDIQNMQRKYELRLAEIALEEAQNAKSQVRMTRDSEGNWNYTYTADENKISEAEQKYEDALYSMQQANEDYIENLQSQIIQAQSDMVQQMSEIYKNSKGENGELTEAEQAQIADIYNTSMGLISGYAQQLNGVLGNNSQLAMESFGTMNDYMQQAKESITTGFDETFLSTATGYETLAGYMQNFKDTTITLTTNLNTAWTDWQANFSSIMETAGTSMTGFKDVVEQSVKDIQVSNEELIKSSDNLQQEVEKNYQDAGNEAYNFSKTHNGAIQEIVEKNETLVTQLDLLIEKEAGVTNGARDLKTETKDVPGYFDGIEKASETLGAELGSLKTALNNAAGAFRGFQDEYEKNRKTRQDVVDTYVKAFSGSFTAGTYETDSGIKFVYNPYQDKGIVLMDSGGYTGAWGPSGKAAILHEKELVLNKDDTANMLKTVGIVRDISGMIDSNARLATNANLYSATVANGNSGISQEVTIHAEFPNANNQYEIQAAFDNLINKASQYVNRK